MIKFWYQMAAIAIQYQKPICPNCERSYKRLKYLFKPL